MRLRHKINHGWTPPVHKDPDWERRVEREAENQSTASARDYQRAQGRLARAEQRLASARVDSPTRSMARLEAIVEARRQELLALERIMKATSAGSQHMGKGSFWPMLDSDGQGGL